MEKTELTVMICGKGNYVSEDNEVFIPPDREVSYGCYGVSSNQEDMLQQTSHNCCCYCFHGQL